MRLLRKLVFALLVCVVIFWTLFPAVYLFLTSVKPASLLFSTSPDFLFPPDFDGYSNLLFDQRYSMYFGNSIIVTVITTILTLFIGSLCAFAFNDFQFRFKKTIFYLIMLTRMYPPITTLIPVFFIMTYINLIDTRVALIIIYTSFQLPLVVWVMNNFFVEIPKGIRESALLDGCNPVKYFFWIAIPLAGPGLVACAVLTFVLTWNEFLFAMVLTSINAKTAPVALMSFIEVDGAIQWGSVAVLGFTTVFPIIFVLIIFHKYLVKGLIAGAIKG